MEEQESVTHVKTLENVEILDPIPYNPDMTQIMRMLRTRGDKQRFEKIIEELLGLVQPLAHPRAVYRVCRVEERGDDWVVVEGVRFNSRLVRDTLEHAERVFPMVVTCGSEVAQFKLPGKDLMREYCLDAIKNSVVFAASQYVNQFLRERFAIVQLSSLNPGEMDSFPSTQHQNIFALLGNVEDMIGVKLTEKCALVPTKSGSGLLFPSEKQFFGCQLCPQHRCPGRRAAFDSELAKKYGERARKHHATTTESAEF